MNTLIHKQLFCTTKYFITGKGLHISMQSIFGFREITIPFDKLKEEITFGKAYNMDLMHTSYTVLFLGIMRLLYLKTFTDLWFLFLFVIFIVCIVVVIFSARKTVKEPELQIFKYFSGNIDNVRLEKFLKNLFELKEDIDRFKMKDSRDGTNFEKQFTDLVSLYFSEAISEQEFFTRRRFLKLSSLPDYKKFGPFYN